MKRVSTRELTLVKAALLKRQDFKCQICTIEINMATACVDHDHRTGLIRDALCRNCNGLEGKLFNIATRGKRNRLHKDFLGSVILYWIRHEQDRTGYLHPLHLLPEEKKVKVAIKAKKRRIAKKAAATK